VKSYDIFFKIRLIVSRKQVFNIKTHNLRPLANIIVSTIDAKKSAKKNRFWLDK